jgi:tRNA (guanine37-N1)-methyltransferase
MRFDVISIFPTTVTAAFEVGVVGRGIKSGLLSLHGHDLRDYSQDKHRKVDDMPFGGGAGMVLKPEPVFAAVESIQTYNPGRVVLLEPWGESLTQRLVCDLAREPGLIIVCGRYEGIDDRVRSGLNALEISIGDYVLSGGEIPAMVLIDAVARQIPGVLGAEESLDQDSFSAGLVGYPQYTRPAEYRGLRVPDVLLSGDHARIADWRLGQAQARTESRGTRAVS